jgi:hypothetical protein
MGQAAAGAALRRLGLLRSAKPRFLVLLFQKYALLALSGLATLFTCSPRKKGSGMALLGKTALGDSVLGSRFSL